MCEGKNGNQGRRGIYRGGPVSKVGKERSLHDGKVRGDEGRWGKSHTAVENLRRKKPYRSTEDASRHLISGHCVVRESF